MKAQTELVLKPTDIFQIPANNSTISFGVNGTYSQARLENGAWVFTDLILSNSVSSEKLNLTVSARDSKITITSYIKSNSTFAGSPAKSVRLRYVVSGRGSQTFNLHLNPKEGDYSVVSDGVFLGLYDGWIISDSALIITGERRNVTISYYGVPETFTIFSNQPFYLQHSVIIIASIILAITVILAIAVRMRSKKQSLKAVWKTNKLFLDKRSAQINLKENKDGHRNL